MDTDLIRAVQPLGLQWPALDPFLFCVHHRDAYPAGTPAMGPPPATLRGRHIGMDFEGREGWRMYHGDVVPGFPRHPHRGFETISIVRDGYVDHADSLGATARIGRGDVQWMTAGRGIVHAEMFPMVNTDRDNPTELFQLWLNLPKADKMVDPYFTMFWADAVPRLKLTGDDGRATEVQMIAGAYGPKTPPSPPPNSWAARPEADVAVWLLKMAPRARLTLPPAAKGSNRMLYHFAGERLEVAGRSFEMGHAIEVRADRPLPLRNGEREAEVLMLQGRPIGEPVVQHGPFVMNTVGEIRQAVFDFQTTGFGGWPWGRNDPVHARERGRFAVHADGREDVPA